MRRPTNRPPRIPRDVARYNRAVALFASIAALLLVALVSPGIVNLEIVLPLLIPLLTLMLGYYFAPRRRQ